MSDTVAFRRRLTHTPLRDLVRGRITGRLDWRGRLVRSTLPGEAKDVIGRVTDRTRLWKLEKAGVASELMAHFFDGLDGGADVDQIIRDFGDEKTAAQLIRRAKRRGRSLVWQVWRVAAYGMSVVVGLYALIFLRFLVTRPTVSVDYVAQLNAPLQHVPADDRAWPLYRRALLSLGRAKGHRDDALNAEIAVRDDVDGSRRFLSEATPVDAEWPVLTRWLDAHAEGFALLREAASKASMGFVLGPNGSMRDPELGFDQVAGEDGPLVSVLLPMLNQGRWFAQLLSTDARYAVAQNDGRRAAADVAAMLGIARQMRTPFYISSLVAIGIDELAFTRIEQTLAERPDFWTAADLAGLAHGVASVGGDTPGSLLDLAGERMFFYDMMQRSYSDDGHGDGHLTRHGVAVMSMIFGINGLGLHGGDTAGEVAEVLAQSAASIAVSSRRDVVTEYDRLMNLISVCFDRPLRDQPDRGGPFEQYNERLQQIRQSPVLLTRYMPLPAMMWSLEHGAAAAERTLGRRDGVVVALAVEAYRRAHSVYPLTLDVLVPDLLPHVPPDRITGDSVRYRLIDGRPVVYSVGVDRKDDGGRAAVRYDPHVVPAARATSPQAAAVWPAAGDASPLPDGDWILFDGRPAARVFPGTQPAH